MKHSKNWRQCICCLCVILSVILLAACGDGFGKVYNEDIRITSPDRQYNLIIREWGTIGGTGAEIYIEKANALIPSFTRKEIGKTIADDCIYPFAEGNYSVQWESSRVVISYFSGTPAEDAKNPDTWKRSVEYVF